MTEQELIDYGYKPQECKIGPLFFKDQFFVKLKDGVADVRYVGDDMTTLGEANTIEELRKLEVSYFIQVMKIHRILVAAMYGKICGEYPEYVDDADKVFQTELEAFEIVNNNWYETNFDPAIDRKEMFLNELTHLIYGRDIIGKGYRGE